MTQSEQNAMVSTIAYKVCEYSNGSLIDCATDMGEYIINNPSDFGLLPIKHFEDMKASYEKASERLVSMEEMFEFAEWMNLNVFPDARSNIYILKSDGMVPFNEVDFYTTSELFQTFKNNKA